MRQIKCVKCSRTANSSYIRLGQEGILNKIGFYCRFCKIHYDLKGNIYDIENTVQTITTH